MRKVLLALVSCVASGCAPKCAPPSQPGCISHASLPVRENEALPDLKEEKKAGKESLPAPEQLTSQDAYAMIKKTKKLIKGMSTKDEARKLIGEPTSIVGKDGMPDPNGDIWIYGGLFPPTVTLTFNGDLYQEAAIDPGAY